MPDPTAPANATLASSTLTGISAVSPADIWAVGSYALSGTVLTGLTLTMHHDGHRVDRGPEPELSRRYRVQPGPHRPERGGRGRTQRVWAVGTIFTTDGANAARSSGASHPQVNLPPAVDLTTCRPPRPRGWRTVAVGRRSRSADVAPVGKEGTDFGSKVPGVLPRGSMSVHVTATR